MVAPHYKNHKSSNDEFMRARRDALADMIKEFGIKDVLKGEITARAIESGLIPPYSVQNYRA